MAFDPYAAYDMTNAYAVTPAQRLQSTLAGTKYGKTGAEQKFALGTFDTSKAYKKQVPNIVGQFSRRGLETSGMKNLALAEAAAAYVRQQDVQRQAMQDAWFNAALQDIDAYATYAGDRYGSTQGSSQERARRAAEIRAALS